MLSVIDLRVYLFFVICSVSAWFYSIQSGSCTCFLILLCSDCHGCCLVLRAIGHRFHAILVDNGCLRMNEAALVCVETDDVETVLVVVSGR